MISKDNILRYETRKKIYDCINKHPGLHLSKISRLTKIPRTTVIYHLRFLKKQQLISEKFEGRYKRFYVYEKISAKDREILNILRQDVPCKIILHLYSTLVCSQIELSKGLHKSPTTIEFHLKKLLDMGIIAPVNVENGCIRRNFNSCYIMERRPIKSEIIYGFKNKDILLHVHRLIVKYGKGLPDQKTTSTLIKDIQEEDMSDELPDYVFHFDGAVKKAMDAVHEVFPHPYHV